MPSRACSSRRAVAAAAGASSAGPKRAAVAAATNASGLTPNSRRKSSPRSPNVALRGVSIRWSTRNDVSSCRQEAATPRGLRRTLRAMRKTILVSDDPAIALRRGRRGEAAPADCGRRRALLPRPPSPAAPDPDESRPPCPAEEPVLRAELPRDARPPRDVGSGVTRRRRLDPADSNTGGNGPQPRSTERRALRARPESDRTATSRIP